MEDLLYKDEVYKIVGRCIAVYNELGPGFLEEVYQEALEREFHEGEIPYKREAPLRIMYKGQPLEKMYFADFVCFGKIIVELKAVSAIAQAHINQVANYLSATGMELGLLVNFGNAERLEWRRHIHTRKKLREDSHNSSDSRF